MCSLEAKHFLRQAAGGWCKAIFEHFLAENTVHILCDFLVICTDTPKSSWETTTGLHLWCSDMACCPQRIPRVRSARCGWQLILRAQESPHHYITTTDMALSKALKVTFRPANVPLSESRRLQDQTFWRVWLPQAATPNAPLVTLRANTIGSDAEADYLQTQKQQI